MARHIALGYVRLSGRKEGQDVTPAVQRQSIERVASEHSWRTDWYDEGSGLHSARKRTNLPQWDALFERALTDKEVAAVVGYDLRRLFRDAEAFANAAKRLRKAGVKLIFAQEGEVDPTDPYKWFMSSIQAGAAEMESLLTTDRLLKYHAEIRARGVYTGHHAPFGVDRVGHANNGTLKFEPNDSLKVIVAFLKLYTEKGLGPQRAAPILRDQGYQWRDRSGNPKALCDFHLYMTLRKLPLYKGIIDDSLYNRAAIKHERNKVHHNGNVQRYDVLLLKGILVCAQCGHNLASSSVPEPGRGVMYAMYRHQYWNGSCHPGRRISSKAVDDQVWEFLQALSNAPPEVKEANARAASQEPEEEKDTTATQRATLKKRIHNLTLMLADEQMDRESVVTALDEARAQLAQIEAPKVIPFKRPRLTYEDALERQNEIANLSRALLTPEEKNELMGLLFEKVTIDLDTRIVKCYPFEEYRDWFGPN